MTFSAASVPIWINEPGGSPAFLDRLCSVSRPRFGENRSPSPASLAGLIGVFGYTDYSASKFALVGFSEALRSELKAYNITVSVLCPPDTDTPGLAIENRTKPEETRAIAAAAKVMSPDAVADALIRGMARRTFLIIPGVDGRLSVLAKRLFPGVVERIMDRTVRQVTRGRDSAPQARSER